MADAKRSLLQALESDKENQIRLLQSFVQAASPNPPGNTEAAAAVLTNYLASKGIPFEIIEPQTGCPNIVSEFQGGKGSGPRVVLNGHIDVFPVGNTTGWTRDPYSGDISDGRIHGRGVVDMKSGTASLVIAYAFLYERREFLKGSVALCAVSDEETGGHWGTQYLIKHDRARWGGDVMLSAEPTGQTIRFSEKGTLRLSGTVMTKGAHGAYLNLSKGAIRTATGFLADAIEAVESLNVSAQPEIAAHLHNPETLAIIDQAMGPGTSTIIARPTVNIGTIKGGMKVNMIPDTCQFELDIRLPVGLTAEEVIAVLDSIKQQYSNATITLRKQEAASNPSSFSPIDHPMIRCLENSVHLVGGSLPVAIPSMGATDCKHYRYAGVPAGLR
ncbi:conserved hypothetical protein [Aspergillus terreus NIH2624]|uniref:Peptidase M20 dimerisation domain-containing protein n=1 Tax=Aspergillus terreus (strain NIH 2624 / FGSC A1156) TaxID=341663 RepID=Q0CBZ9_ASPTN|nr:uncharacterized protein ATEG_08785 [Aspergillus terreus NIH2624]EAU30917.1 conserved hypothetical protein [Aspergillus terreus NIH2624]